MLQPCRDRKLSFLRSGVLTSMGVNSELVVNFVNPASVQAAAGGNKVVAFVIMYSANCESDKLCGSFG